MQFDAPCTSVSWLWEQFYYVREFYGVHEKMTGTRKFTWAEKPIFCGCIRVVNEEKIPIQLTLIRQSHKYCNKIEINCQSGLLWRMIKKMRRERIWILQQFIWCTAIWNEMEYNWKSKRINVHVSKGRPEKTF